MSSHVNQDTPAFLWNFPGGRAYFFRANNRFIREIEQNDPEDRSFTESVFQNDGTWEYWYQLFWALTITHRTWEDPDMTFEKFLEMLPGGDDMQLLKNESMRIITNFFQLKSKETPQAVNEKPEEEPEGNLPPAPTKKSEPDQPTGDSSTDSSSANTE